MPLTTILNPIPLPVSAPKEGASILPLVFPMAPGELVSVPILGASPNKLSRVSSILIDATRAFTGFRVVFNDSKRSIVVPSGSESCHLCYTKDGNFTVQNLNDGIPAIFRAWIFNCPQPVYERFPGYSGVSTLAEIITGEFSTTPGIRILTSPYQPPVVPYGAIWDTKQARPGVAFTNGNYTVSQTVKSAVRSLGYRSSGKYYFELSGAVGDANNSRTGFGTVRQGDGSAPVPQSDLMIAFLGGVTIGGNYVGSVNIQFGNGSESLPNGVAVDLDAKLLWVRKEPGTPWNGAPATGQPANDPATGVGGFSMASMGLPVAISTFSPATLEKLTTLHTGHKPFIGAVPAGFQPGWPVI